MTTLNVPPHAMVAGGAHAATDVTGFGLLTKKWRASGVGLLIEAVLFMPVPDLITEGIVPAERSTTRARSVYHLDLSVSQSVRIGLDAQTSGIY